MKRLSLFLLAFLFASTLHAQRVISRIEVVGNVPAAIVLPQSALVAGRTYSDADLDVAIARLRRLPFVFDARYLVDGTTLVLDVNGITPLSFDLESLGARTRFATDSMGRISGGGRIFHGAGIAQARVSKLLADGGETRTLDLEYANYGIGGTRFFAVAGGSVPFTSDRHSEPDPTLQLTVGYPLSLRQTLTASAIRSGFEGERELFGLPRPLLRDLERTTVELRWAYDTTEDPYFTRRGTYLTAAPSWTAEKSLFEGATFFFPPGTGTIHTTRSEGDVAMLSAEALQFWPVSSRGAVSAGVFASTENRDFDVVRTNVPVQNVDGDSSVVRLSLGYGHNLFDWSSPLDRGRNRFELGVTASRRWVESVIFNEQSAGIGYVFRKPFGTVRVRFDYDFD